MTISEFLAARLDEDEAAARAFAESVEPGDYVIELSAAVDSVTDLPLFDPARTLVTVSAMRAILKMHPQYSEGEDGCTWCRSRDGACETLRLLALPFYTHPDYDPAWSPS